MNLDANPVQSFTGHDGTKHRIVSLTSRKGGGNMLCDLWEGHGLRLLCVLSNGDENLEAQTRALLRDYETEASLVDEPLSRRVDRKEFLTPQLAALTA